MKVALLTREFPPEVYGGAGVHVEHLAAELARLVDVGVHCFGAPRPSELVVGTYEQPSWLPAGGGGADAVLQTMGVDLAMAAGVEGADLVHTHTWYTNFAGHLAKLLHGVPHVMTSHSLEPLRPWKAEQLGGGYALSRFCERTAIEAADAVIAVSGAMRGDILTTYPHVDPDRVKVIHNGVDAEVYRPDPSTGVLDRLGIPRAGGRPYVIFVGRITRQKGLDHLLDAVPALDPSALVVLCASAPDTEAEGIEFAERIASVPDTCPAVKWISETLPRADVVQLLTHAAVFVCPSVYEPFGLVNVEAMGCEAPVVATAVGGIPEIVVHGETGLLVPPADPAALAAAINDLLADPAKARRMGQAGRARVHDRFSWPAIARRTVDLYRRVLR
ncbi:MAG: glycogen synthase [Acidimicrobiales bacterium]